MRPTTRGPGPTRAQRPDLIELFDLELRPYRQPSPGFRAQRPLRGPKLHLLTRSGLLRGGFLPPANFRELRLASRQMQKLTGMLAAEKNRLHKALSDAGIRLPVVVSDIHGQSARAMVKGLIAGERPEQVLRYASKRLKASEEELLDVLDGELTAEHRFVLSELMEHIEDLERLRSRPFGRASVRAITSQRARAIPMRDGSCAKRPTRPRAPAAPWPSCSNHCSSGGGENAPSSPWPTRY